MITLHAYRGRVSIVILQDEANKVNQLIAQLAEILVETKEASFDQVEQLRVAIEKKDGSWQEITQDADATLGDLDIGDNSRIGYIIGDEEFGYVEPDADLTE